MKARHPHISGLTININDDDAARYKAAGWLLPKPRKKAEENKASAGINDSTGDGEAN